MEEEPVVCNANQAFFMYGIIGNPLDHSWSPAYFAKKFDQKGIQEEYLRFPLKTIDEFPDLLKRYPRLKGLNVTIPYKEKVIPFLATLSQSAITVQSVNCIQFINGKTMGHNTDVIGFENSLNHFLPYHFQSQALILGTGGASKAVAAVLKNKNIPFKFVSRKKGTDVFTYTDLSPDLISTTFRLIINTTPLGMWPNLEAEPEFPYSSLTKNHYLFDLIYNPEETQFLREGKIRGATIQNGMKMLVEQAEASWEIWQATG